MGRIVQSRWALIPLSASFSWQMIGATSPPSNIAKIHLKKNTAHDVPVPPVRGWSRLCDVLLASGFLDPS